jgi:hypothetical protein
VASIPGISAKLFRVILNEGSPVTVNPPHGFGLTLIDVIVPRVPPVAIDGLMLPTSVTLHLNVAIEEFMLRVPIEVAVIAPDGVAVIA